MGHHRVPAKPPKSCLRATQAATCSHPGCAMMAKSMGSKAAGRTE